MLPPVLAAYLTVGTGSLDPSKFGASQKLGNQIGPIYQGAVWATPIGIVVAVLPAMRLHGPNLLKEHDGSGCELIVDYDNKPAKRVLERPLRVRYRNPIAGRILHPSFTISSKLRLRMTISLIFR
jgi:hypothetical protein